MAIFKLTPRALTLKLLGFFVGDRFRLFYLILFPLDALRWNKDIPSELRHSGMCLNLQLGNSTHNYYVHVQNMVDIYTYTSVISFC